MRRQENPRSRKRSKRSKFAGPAGQRRAKISSNWLTIILVRARGAAPGAPPAKSTPTAARELLLRDGFPPGRGLPRPPERAKRAKRGPQD
eukprot:5091788-Pyramimonas_sp.AAC.1